MAENEIEDLNKITYTTPKAVEVYSKMYLRSYEEYIFKKYFLPDLKVLDLGCGTGRSTYHIKKLNVEVIGIDMIEDFIKKGKELYPDLDLRVMNASVLDFPEEHFDIVFFSNQGIDYTHKRLEVFRESYRVLKKNGLFIYTFHNSICLPRTRRTWLDLFANIKHIRIGQHIRTERHDNGELKIYFNNVWSERRLVKSAGFKVEEVLANKTEKKAFLYTVLAERWPMFICRK